MKTGRENGIFFYGDCVDSARNEKVGDENVLECFDEKQHKNETTKNFFSLKYNLVKRQNSQHSKTHITNWLA